MSAVCLVDHRARNEREEQLNFIRHLAGGWRGEALSDEDERRCRLIHRYGRVRHRAAERLAAGHEEAVSCEARSTLALERIKELQNYMGFSAEAERLHKAKTFEEFCERLPHVNLMKTYGSDNAKQSPFPLIWAMKASRPLERVQLLLQHGARTDLQVGLRETVLHHMALMKRKTPVRLEILRLLILHGADINAQNIYSKTPLAFALERGSLEDCSFFLEAGARVGLSEIKCAAVFPKKFGAILEHLRTNPELCDDVEDWRPHVELMLAEWESLLAEARRDGENTGLYEARVETLQASLGLCSDQQLLSKGESGKLKWDTAPAALLKPSSVETLEDFRKSLADVDMSTYPADKPDQPIYWPLEAKEQRPERLWAMLVAGASVRGGPNGEALHFLARQCRRSGGDQAKLIELLVQAGADIEAIDYQGWTPLGCAVAVGGRHEVQAFVDAGADLDATIAWGNWASSVRDTPVLFAAAENKWKFKCLYEAGANPRSKNSLGLSLEAYLCKELEALDAEAAEWGGWGDASRRDLTRRRALAFALGLIE